MYVDAHELVEGIVFEFEEAGRRHECCVVDDQAQIEIGRGIGE